MKKYLYLIVAALLMGFTTSCDSDPSDSSTNAGGTAVKKMCGEWVANVYYCESASSDISNIENWEWEDLGSFHLLTYNTAANKANEMWVDDQGNCYLGDSDDYSHKIKVNVQYGSKTFSVTDAANEYGENATVVGGKVMLDAASIDMGRGQFAKADSIVYYVNVNGAGSGYLKVSGYRYNFEDLE
jgi:hypothetical protein